MAKLARRYDFYLPLQFNNGRSIPDDHFGELERQLLARFGGVTSQQREFPLRGMWLGGTHLYFDQVVVMTVLDFRRQGSTRFIAQLKANLLTTFDQLEILITESGMRVH